MHTKETIVIDFDGTIVDHAFPYIGPAYPHAIAAIKELHEKYYIVISSCRNNPMIRHQGPIDTYQEMINWLDTNGVPYDRIDDGKSGKPIALYYIDDRAIRFAKNWNRLRFTL